MERKDFLKKGIAVCGLSMLPGAFLESCSKSGSTAPTSVNFTLDLTATANASLNAVGGYVYSNGLIIIRFSTSTYVALSSACTHEGCTVKYSSAMNEILCPCHGGTYNASTGSVLGGPPPSALTKYSVTKSGNILTIKS